MSDAQTQRPPEVLSSQQFPLWLGYFTEAMEALRKDDGFLSYIKASYLLLRIIKKYYF